MIDMRSDTLVSNPLWIGLYLLSGVCAALVAKARGRKLWPWFRLGLLFGPLALLFVLLARRRSNQI